MIDSSEISDSFRHAEWLASLIHGKQMPATLRNRVAGACHAIALEHHHAIVLLIGNVRYAAAFALARPAFESFLRGEWLTYCASEDQVLHFANDKDPPNLPALLAALEQHSPYADGQLTSVKRSEWPTLCSFTHTGGLHAQRWMTKTAIEPSYLANEVQGLLSFAWFVGSMATMAMAHLTNDENAARQVLEAMKRRANEA